MYKKFLFVIYVTFVFVASNAQSKRNLKRFPRAKNPEGENMNALSCFSEENRKVDAKAFATIMKHIKEIDETQQTVVCVQVGIRTCPRDYNSLANNKFEEQVPAKLISYLEKNKKNLIPELDSIWRKSNYRTNGTWSDIFGNDADELFMAWYLAAGNGFTVTFTSKANKKLHAEMLWIQELEYVNGRWKKLRHLNGGQSGRGSVHYTKLHLVDEIIQREQNDYPIILNTKLFTYE